MTSSRGVVTRMRRATTSTLSWRRRSLRVDKAVTYLMELRRQAENRTIDIDPTAPYPDYTLPEDLVESAVDHICGRLYGDSDEAKACDDKKRRSLVGDSVRIAMRATLARASKDLNTKADTVSAPKELTT